MALCTKASFTVAQMKEKKPVELSTIETEIKEMQQPRMAIKISTDMVIQ